MARASTRSSVSIDYLVRPIEVLRQAARVLRPGGLVVLTFSRRRLPTNAVWLVHSATTSRR